MQHISFAEVIKCFWQNERKQKKSLAMLDWKPFCFVRLPFCCCCCVWSWVGCWTGGGGAGSGCWGCRGLVRVGIAKSKKPQNKSIHLCIYIPCVKKNCYSNHLIQSKTYSVTKKKKNKATSALSNGLKLTTFWATSYTCIQHVKTLLWLLKTQFEML